MSEPERLPEDLRELLDAERELDAPPAATRARLLERLGPLVIPAAIGAGAAAGGVALHAASAEAASASGAEVAGTAAAAFKVKAVVALIAATLGAVGGAATHAALSPAPAAVGTQAPPLPRVTLEKREPVALPSAVTAPAPTEAAVPAAPDAPEASASAGRKPVKAPSLRDERLLLERATSALVHGDATSALASLREHARRFPRGELMEEREVLLVRARRAAGFPSSPQQGTIDAPASK